MKIKIIFLINLFTITLTFGQQQEVTFSYQNIDFSAAPRTSISPMSIKLWDNYGNGGPSVFGTVMEIYGLVNHQTSQLYFGGWDNSKIKYREAFYNQNTWSDWITLLDSKNNIESAGRLLITGQGNHYINNGNVGIGTETPSEKLSIAGTYFTSPAIVSLETDRNDAQNVEVGIIKAKNGPTEVARIGFSRSFGSNTGYISFYTRPENSQPLTEAVRVAVDGNVGIGTITPTERLAVNGKIKAKEIRVEATGWPDYVFEEGYKVGALQELESYIKTNKHLPEMPSAKEVTANGIELGEMNKILLKKIEELTLIIIEQNKAIVEQGKTQEILKKQLSELLKNKM